MANQFKLGILFGDKPDIRPPGQIGNGWDICEIPVSIQVQPFESENVWAAKKAQIEAWGLPPIRVSSHFLQHFGLQAVGPSVDWEQLEFWTRRSFRRLSEVGVKVAGVFGGFYTVPEGMDRGVIHEQAIKFTRFLGEQAEPYGITIALEPFSDLKTLWPRYLEGIEFAKEVDHPLVKVMADLNYFIALDQPLEDIAKYPEMCTHVHIAEGKGQPGIGDRNDIYERLFRILAGMGYEGAVDCACAWVSSDGGELDFGKETRKSLAYLKDLRAKIYAEKNA
jgi:sugar phosphate isomerase/epimerase